MSGETETPLIVHASAVCIETGGLLIRGASGTGKSTLALQMIGLGAQLVADDRVSILLEPSGALRMSSPEPLAGLIEARGMGLLQTHHRSAMIKAVVDLDRVEEDRLPERHSTTLFGIKVPCFRKVESPAFAAMLLVYMKGGRAAP